MDIVYVSSLWSVEEFFTFTYSLSDTMRCRFIALTKGYHYDKLRN